MLKLPFLKVGSNHVLNNSKALFLKGLGLEVSITRIVTVIFEIVCTGKCLYYTNILAISTTMWRNWSDLIGEKTRKRWSHINVQIWKRHRWNQLAQSTTTIWPQGTLPQRSRKKLRTQTPIFQQQGNNIMEQSTRYRGSSKNSEWI